VLEREGFEIRFHDDSLSEQLRSKTRSGYSVFLMSEPTTSRGVTIRRNYFYPFWNIETTAKRWDWLVARSRFDETQVPKPEAQRFADFWRQRLFQEAADRTTREGFIYAPLQGRLLSHRSFQVCSPLDMLRHILEVDTGREVMATLHPRETYSPQEREALSEMENTYARLKVSDEAMVPLLQTCDYVATQNSAVSLSGFFFRKPTVLFGQSNFHHIAAKALELGPKEALRRGAELTPDYDAYLWWFLQKMSINAGREDAEEDILEALVRAGWVDRAQ